MLLRPVPRDSVLFVAGYLGNAARLLRILGLFLATGLFICYLYFFPDGFQCSAYKIFCETGAPGGLASGRKALICAYT
ncbi:hypothetical protein CNY67_10065 [Desulfovibrio sp. G11]|nr:hypothetical protein CNY67_10065 [Desulfovibrio sp. G11]